MPGSTGKDFGKLPRSPQVKKTISFHVGENKEFERPYRNGELAVEFCPQGTLAKRCCAGGAGIPVSTSEPGPKRIPERNEVKNGSGQDYILERTIRANLSIIEGWRVDKAGNLLFRETARNFNQQEATAGLF